MIFVGIITTSIGVSPFELSKLSFSQRLMIVVVMIVMWVSKQFLSDRSSQFTDMEVISNVGKWYTTESKGLNVGT